jgi:hypothetical protein
MSGTPPVWRDRESHRTALAARCSARTIVLAAAHRTGQSARVLAGPRGYPIPFWLGLTFVALAAAYVVTRAIIDLRLRAKSRADEARDRDAKP